MCGRGLTRLPASAAALADDAAVLVLDLAFVAGPFAVAGGGDGRVALEASVGLGGGGAAEADGLGVGDG